MRVPSRLLTTAAMAAVMTVGLVGAGLAQDATPMAGGDEQAAGAYPNHLHLGTCAELDPAPAVPLADLQFPDWVASLSGDAAADIEVVMPEPDDFGNAPIPAAVATTEVPVALADIIAGKHALNVHNPENPEEYVACGNVGGVPDERGDLFIGLGEHEGSGYSGAAWFHDNGGSSTTVVVFLTQPSAQSGIEADLAAMAAAVMAEEELEATPMAEAEATPEVDAEATPVT
jgi:hypothetical protein